MSLTINHFYRFRDFTLDVNQRVLLRADRPLALTPKAFDTCWRWSRTAGASLARRS